MASIAPRKNRSSWVVSYFLYLRPSGKKRKYKYVRSRQEAQGLRREVEVIEERSRMGLAPLEQVQRWVDADWISAEEVDNAFPGFDDMLTTQKRQGRASQTTDYGKLLALYNGYLEKNVRQGRGDYNHR